MAKVLKLVNVMIIFLALVLVAMNVNVTYFCFFFIIADVINCTQDSDCQSIGCLSHLKPKCTMLGFFFNAFVGICECDQVM
ncbi:Nodule Cysteine-Rich (NCR) secreted peptide [Medicago truncatula]|uniref:Nodule Cysteine-Rich (NCR) secreted peptide n=1 Tax=Medicago truncatula TaxID=3880 RepID=G7JTI3_MEDTR|nr:Nodule Cysteine-Rich (NCR) secreted peptide [Medicago truncatula]